MDIYVASSSKHKVGAAKEAALALFPDAQLNVRGIKSASDINEQPVGHEETLRGALNRMKNMQAILGATRYDLLVAMESGIFPVTAEGEERWFDAGWVVVENADGTKSIAQSAAVEFPAHYVAEAKKRGFETTTVGSVIAEQTGADGTDPHAFLTGNAVTRGDMLQQTLRTALGQLLREHPELSEIR